MLDTTPVTMAITRLISTGTTEQTLLAAVAGGKQCVEACPVGFRT